MKINKVSLILKDVTIPFYLKPLKKFISRYNVHTVEIKHYFSLKMNNQEYLIVSKEPALDFRCKCIKIN